MASADVGRKYGPFGWLSLLQAYRVWVLDSVSQHALPRTYLRVFGQCSCCGQGSAAVRRVVDVRTVSCSKSACFAVVASTKLRGAGSGVGCIDWRVGPGGVWLCLRAALYACAIFATCDLR